MTIKNLVFSLFVSILIVSCDNKNSEDKDKDKKEFKDICDCAEWSLDKQQEIIKMTNSEFRDEFEDYDSWDDYSDELHPECEDLFEEWGEEWGESLVNERGEEWAEAYLNNIGEEELMRAVLSELEDECDLKLPKIKSLKELNDEVEEKFNRALSGGAKREENRGSGKDYAYENRRNYNDPCDCITPAIELVQELNNLDDFELSQFGFEYENFDNELKKVMDDSGCSDVESDAFDDCVEAEWFQDELMQLVTRMSRLEQESSYDNDYEFDF